MRTTSAKSVLGVGTAHAIGARHRTIACHGTMGWVQANGSWRRMVALQARGPPTSHLIGQVGRGGKQQERASTGALHKEECACKYGRHYGKRAPWPA